MKPICAKDSLLTSPGGIRSNDVIDRSVARIDMYQTLDTIKVDTVNKNVCEIVSEILTL